MRLWICIPVHNRIQLTLKCLECLQRQEYAQLTIVVCDDGSTDGTAAQIRSRFPDVVVLEGDGTLWWTGATNRCVRYALEHATGASDAVVLLNNDLEAPPNLLSVLADASARYPGSIMTSVEFDIRTQNMVFPGARHSWWTAKARLVNPATDHLPGDPTVATVTDGTGRGTLIPLAVMRSIGLFDEHRLPHYGADYDFTYRAKNRGYAILVCFGAHVFSHVEETGMTKVSEAFSLRGLYRYLTNIKSPANIKVRWGLAVNNCPKFLLPSYLLLDLSFVVAGYFRFHLKRWWQSVTTS